MAALALDRSAEARLRELAGGGGGDGGTVGLLMGAYTAGVCQVLFAAPTPRAEAPSRFDAAWTRAHAAQARRMMCGGVAVVGVFYAGTAQAAGGNPPEASLRALAAALASGDAPRMVALLALGDKLSAVFVEAGGAAKSEPRRAALRVEGLASAFVPLVASVAVRVDVAVGGGGYGGKGPATVQRKIAVNVERWARRAEAAVALLGDAVLSGSAQPLRELAGRAEAGAAPLRASLLLPLGDEDADAWETLPVDSITGSAHVSGELLCCALVHSAATGAEAAAALREDAARTLRERLALLAEELEPSNADAKTAAAAASPLATRAVAAAGSWPLPRRVAVPVDPSPLRVSDLLIADEDAADALERAREYLGLAPPQGVASDAWAAACEVEGGGRQQQQQQQQQQQRQPAPSACGPRAVLLVGAVVAAALALAATALFGTQ